MVARLRPAERVAAVALVGVAVVTLLECGAEAVAADLGLGVGLE